MQQLSGLHLRYAITFVLLRAGVPLRIADIERALAREGFETHGRSSKEISDALRWEVGRGRAVRLRRGVYVVGHIPKQTRSRIVRRVRELQLAGR